MGHTRLISPMRHIAPIVFAVTFASRNDVLKCAFNQRPQQVSAGCPLMKQLSNACDQKVSVLQTDDFVVVSPFTPLSQAIEAMKQDEGGCVIISDDGRIAGIFTERDLLTKIWGQNVDLESPIKSWMQPVVETLTPEATIGDAVRLMNEKSFRNVPLVKHGDLKGSISVFDIITYLAESYPKTTMNLPPLPAQIMDTVDGG